MRTKALVRFMIHTLRRMECPFWACEGPQRPQHMITCCKCWAIREGLDWLRVQRGLKPLVYAVPTFKHWESLEKRRERRNRRRAS